MEFEVKVPKGWDCQPLKVLTSKIGSGATPDGGSNSYKAEGIALVRSMNVYDSGFKKNGLAFIDDIQANKLSNVVLQSKDVLLNITGASIARCCIVPEYALPGRVNQHVAILRTIDKKILPEFLHLFLISPKQKNRLLYISGGGATREALTKKMIEEFQIPVPPLPEQTRIVAKLDALFERIDKAVALLEENIKKTGELMEAVLGEVFGVMKADFKNSNVGSFLDNIQTGTTPPMNERRYYENETYNWFAPSDFGITKDLTDSKRKIDPVAVEEGKARIYPPNTLLLVGIGATIGKVGITRQECSSNQQITGLTFKNDVLVDYAFYWFKHIYPAIVAKSSSATLAIINQKGIKELPFVKPPIELQRKIVQYIENVEVKNSILKDLLITKVASLHSLKSSLLDQAFRGEL